MKLKTKLFINFTVLFFLLLNIFGCFLIKIIFYTSIDNTINSSFNEYSMVYLNLKSGENISKVFFEDKDVIGLKNASYLNNIYSPLVNLIVQDMDKNKIYSSLNSERGMPEELYNFGSDDSANYTIVREEGRHQLIINKVINFRDSKYYLLYINDVEKIYEENSRFIFILFLFNIIAGILSVFVIYYFSKAITHPLQKLIYNINEIIQKNYEIKLEQPSKIKEINMLTESFNIMSNEISVQVSLLEQQNQEKQRFIDSLTHEIRTPLTSIVGYSSLFLNKQQFNEEATEKAFENIYKSGKRIEHLTEKLIKLITIDKVSLELREVSVLNVVKEIENTYKNRLDENEIIFKVSGEDFKVYVDEALLGMLFSNFIDNAIKAVINSNEKNIEIILEDYKVSIKDTGKGIPKEDLDKIFEPFFMVDKSRKQSFSGFGLGLSICHSIMKMLSINFNVESIVNKGTRIILYFNGGNHEDR